MGGKTTKSKTLKNKTPEYVNCLWGLICSLSAIDQQRNNVSLFNIISQLNISKENFHKHNEFFVGIPHELVVVFRRAIDSKLCIDKLIVDVKVSLVDPKGEILNELLTPIVFDVGKRTMRFRFQISGFKLTISGDYVYRIEIKQPGSEKFEQINRAPFEVIQMD